MKRLVIIAFVFVGFAFVSCNKECIRPTAQITEDAPVWKSAEEPNTDDESNPAGSGSITDPNNDKDGTTRRRQ
jgi:hypothetical protein